MKVTLTLLAEQKLLPENEIQNLALRAKNDRVSVESLVISTGLLSQSALYDDLAVMTGYFQLKSHLGVQLDEEKVIALTPKVVSKHKVIPIIVRDDHYILICDDVDPAIEKQISQLYENPPWALCTEKVMESLQNKYIVPMELEQLTGSQKDTDALADVHDLSRTGQKIPDMLAMIIQSAVAARATDIQLCPLQNEVAIYHKIDGVKTHHLNIPKSTLEFIVRLILKDANMQEIAVLKPAVGLSQYKIGGAHLSLRVNLIPTSAGVDINLRILDNNIHPLDKLNITPRILTQYRELFNLSKGIVLVTGPTGSGKSTTLYSGLMDSDVSRRTIVSVEDPVEYVVPGVTQVGVNETAGITFQSALKAFLRHDPSIILLGEIRDSVVANEALRASATGHLVLSTLHTNDAISSIPRMLNLGVPGYSLAESLCAVIAQRLVRKVCPSCAVDYTVQFQDTDMIEAGIPMGTAIKKAHEGGCEHCRETGYLGRVALVELIYTDRQIRQLLEEPQVMPTKIRDYIEGLPGYVSLWGNAIEKVVEGLTTFEEVRFMKYEII